MNHKPLAQTGVTLPEIGLGTWEYKGGVEPLRRGISLGARLIDTAEAYQTEEIVGQAIQGIRDKVFVATKVSPAHFRRSDLLQAADNSLRRLKTDYIDLYQLHWLNPALPIEETMAAMEELVDAGKVRFIGVCNFSVSALKQAQAVLTKYKIVSNQISYSLVNRDSEHNVLPHCQHNRITVIAYSPLARGVRHLLAKNHSGVLNKIAATTGKTKVQVALNWCISKEAVIAIPKADSVEHTIDNCNASGWRLSPDQVRLLEKGFPRRSAVDSALRRIAGFCCHARSHLGSAN